MPKPEHLRLIEATARRPENVLAFLAQVAHLRRRRQAPLDIERAPVVTARPPQLDEYPQIRRLRSTRGRQEIDLRQWPSQHDRQHRAHLRSLRRKRLIHSEVIAS